jgi:hypothetical protein
MAAKNAGNFRHSRQTLARPRSAARHNPAQTLNVARLDLFLARICCCQHPQLMLLPFTKSASRNTRRVPHAQMQDTKRGLVASNRGAALITVHRPKRDPPISTFRSTFPGELFGEFRSILPPDSLCCTLTPAFPDITS